MMTYIHLTNAVLHIPAVQPGLAALCGIIVFEPDVDMPQNAQQGDLVEHTFHDKAILDHVQCDGTVHGSAIDVRVVQMMRQVLGQGALTATAISVYGNGYALHDPEMMRPR